jgi:hypothetical protein
MRVLNSKVEYHVGWKHHVSHVLVFVFVVQKSRLTLDKAVLDISGKDFAVGLSHFVQCQYWHYIKDCICI